MAVTRPALLVLIRHGESERNVARKHSRFFRDDESRKSLKGVPDHRVPLTAEGRRQSEVTGTALRKQFGLFDYIYHSGYRRTEETTDGLLSAYSAEERASMIVRHHLFIRERDQGHAYDMTDAEASLAFPWLQDYWETHGPFFARPQGGESLAQVCERVYTFLQKLARTKAEKRVLIVTHGGTLRCFRYVLEGWSYEHFEKTFYSEPATNCSVAWYEHDPGLGKLVLRQCNQVFWDPRDHVTASQSEHGVSSQSSNTE
jgi:broad specificity phosphatase PhoE